MSEHEGGRILTTGGDEDLLEQVKAQEPEPTNGAQPAPETEIVGVSWLTTAEAGAILEVGASRVVQLIDAGTVIGRKTEPHGRYTKGQWLVTEQSVLDYKASRRQRKGPYQKHGTKPGPNGEPKPRVKRGNDATSVALREARVALDQAMRAVASAQSANDKRQARLKEALSE